MLGNLTGWHLLIILAVVLLIFGAAKLPALAKSMGQSARILKSEIAAGKAESAAARRRVAHSVGRATRIDSSACDTRIRWSGTRTPGRRSSEAVMGMSSATATGRARPQRQMTLGQHLREFRRRLLWAAVGLVIGSVAGWFLSDFVLDAMRAPIVALAEEQHRLAELNYDNITGAFDLRIRIAITIGVVLSSPVWLYQIWAFLVPALSRKELKFGLGFFFSAVPLFLAGCAAGALVVPHIVALLTSFAPSGSSSFIQASDYFDFIQKLVLAIGIAFVLPVFLVLLNFVGVLSARTIIRSWRTALIAIVVFAGLATPSADVVSMFLLAIPMVLLYLAAAGIAHLHDRRAARAAAVLSATLVN